MTEVSELIGAELDAAVAHALHPPGTLAPACLWYRPSSNEWVVDKDWHPSTDWSQGGPIIERERIDLKPIAHGKEWRAIHPNDGAHRYGTSPLIAAMRAFCASKQ